MEKSCPPTASAASDSATTSSSSSSHNHNSNSTTARQPPDHVLKQLNKSSLKISKQPHHHHQHLAPHPKHPSQPSIHSTNPQQQPQSQPQPQPQPQPPPQQQPPVYNINKNDFRDVVQKLTGSPAHERFSTPPPIHPPKPPSSRLQRIRPPPLAHVSNRPAPSAQLPLFNHDASLNANATSSTTSNYDSNISSVAGIFNGRPRSPFSPLPPFPTILAELNLLHRFRPGTGSLASLEPQSLSPLPPGTAAFPARKSRSAAAASAAAVHATAFADAVWTAPAVAAIAVYLALSGPAVFIVGTARVSAAVAEVADHKPEVERRYVRDCDFRRKKSHEIPDFFFLYGYVVVGLFPSSNVDLLSFFHGIPSHLLRKSKVENKCSGEKGHPACEASCVLPPHFSPTSAYTVKIGNSVGVDPSIVVVPLACWGVERNRLDGAALEHLSRAGVGIEKMLLYNQSNTISFDLDCQWRLLSRCLQVGMISRPLQSFQDGIRSSAAGGHAITQTGDVHVTFLSLSQDGPKIWPNALLYIPNLSFLPP
ncbi:hypothetical protein ACLOJK_016354 [Asimina triloba]